MSDATEGSHPIPVMSIPAGLADLIETCAKHGQVMVGDKQDIALSSVGLVAAMIDPEKSIPGVDVFRKQVKLWMEDPSSNSIESYLLNDAMNNPMDTPFSTLGALMLMIDWAHLLGDDRVCTMVIVNKSDKPLDFSTGDKGKGYNSFNGGSYHGKQTGHPGTMTSTKGVFTDEYIIPAASNDDGMQYYGLGMFKFQKSAGFMGAGWYGTQGSIGAKLDGSNILKIAFLVGQSGTTAIAVSGDTKSNADFLNDNWSPDSSVQKSEWSNASIGTVRASLSPASGLFLNKPSDHEDMAATVIYSTE